MHIVLVPDGTRKGRTASFNSRHLGLLVLTGAVVLPALLGTLSYYLLAMLDRGTLVSGADQLRKQQIELQAQRETIEKARTRAETHLNALAQRLGQLQAQVMRLNALGVRLTRMAGIDAREFDFRQPPGVGGPTPANDTDNIPETDVLATLTALDRQIAYRSEQLAALEDLHMDRAIGPDMTPSGWPVHGGWISSGFGPRVDPFTGRKSLHQGVDIAGHMGSPVRAMGDGLVTHAGFKEGYGLMVEVNHGNGLRTRYAHATAILVAVGDRIAKGNTVATVGTSGRSTGPHLHFEVLDKDRYIDPASFLEHTGRAVAHGGGRPRG